MSEFVDHYAVLGVSKTATEDDIKRAYRAKALKTHPNKGGDPEEFKKANEANEVLSHPDQRAAYDEKYDEHHHSLGAEAGGGGGGHNHSRGHRHGGRSHSRGHRHGSRSHSRGHRDSHRSSKEKAGGRVQRNYEEYFHPSAFKNGGGPRRTKKERKGGKSRKSRRTSRR